MTLFFERKLHTNPRPETGREGSSNDDLNDCSKSSKERMNKEAAMRVWRWWRKKRISEYPCKCSLLRNDKSRDDLLLILEKTMARKVGRKIKSFFERHRNTLSHVLLRVSVDGINRLSFLSCLTPVSYPAILWVILWAILSYSPWLEAHDIIGG